MSKRRVPQQDRARKTVDRILAAAQQLLEGDVDSRFTTTGIAKIAQVGVGTLYDYFPDREAIAIALLDDIALKEASQIEASIAELADVKPLKELMADVVGLIYDTYRQHVKLHQALWEIAQRNHTNYKRPGERKIVDAIGRLLTSKRKELGRPMDDPNLVAFIVTFTIESLALRLNHEEYAPGDDATRKEEITRIVVQYLGI